MFIKRQKLHFDFSNNGTQILITMILITGRKCILMFTPKITQKELN